MEVQSVVAFDTEELEKLKASNLLKDFVQKQDGCWNHSHWENFLTSVRTLGYNLPADVIGAELEVEKEYYWKVRRGEIVVPETTTVAQEAAGYMEAVIISEESAKLEPVPCPPEVFDKPREPKMPARREPFDPITELENAVVVDEKHIEARAVEEQSPWEKVDFDSLSREEKTAYLKSQLKKKMGEG
jgi:hypothetical protein